MPARQIDRRFAFHGIRYLFRWRAMECVRDGWASARRRAISARPRKDIDMMIHVDVHSLTSAVITSLPAASQDSRQPSPAIFHGRTHRFIFTSTISHFTLYLLDYSFIELYSAGSHADDVAEPSPDGNGRHDKDAVPLRACTAAFAACSPAKTRHVVVITLKRSRFSSVSPSRWRSSIAGSVTRGKRKSEQGQRYRSFTMR